MNKIKVVSQIGFQTMKSQSNEFYVPQNSIKQKKVFFKRPLTPKQVFKYVEKESQVTQSRFKKVERLKTQNFSQFQQFQPSKDGEYWYQDHGSIFQKKINKHNFNRQRPYTSKTFSKQKYDKKKIIQNRESIAHLKNEIDTVLAQIKQEKQLAKIRMDRKYCAYSNKKFKNYWNPRINLLAQTAEQFNKKTIS